MNVAFLKFISSAFSQQSKADKLLERTVRDLKPRSIVQLGVGTGQHALEIIQAASKYGDASRGEAIFFCGIDLFEASPAEQVHLTLREAHKQFSTVADKVRLIPGDPESALQRCANDLTGTDLLVISQQVKQQETVWTFAPRMLLPQSLVLIETNDETNEKASWQIMTPADIPAARRPNGKHSRSAA